MLKKVQEYIEKNNLFENEKKIVIALSGGVDSMTLLKILQLLDFQVIIAHINHQKREQSKIEEQFIINYAKEKNIPCEIYHFKASENKNFQGEAHHARYHFYRQVCQKYHARVVVTAHHADDQIETILLNLMSGSNLYGYAGISKKLKIDDYLVARPFLCLNKNEIINFANEQNVHYFEDSSNNENDYKRNRIRHSIIPQIKQECPNILEKTNSFSTQVYEAFHFIRSISINHLKNNHNKINIKQFKSLDIAVKKDLISLLLEQESIEKNERIINNIISIIESPYPQKILHLKGNFIFKKSYNDAYLTNPVISNDYCFVLEDITKVITTSDFCIYFTKNLADCGANYLKLCYNSIAFPLTIRNRRNEDAILMPFGHKKIKDLFIDKKIPTELRNQIPIVVDGNSEILWVINYAKSQKVIDQKNHGDIFLVWKRNNNAE